MESLITVTKDYAAIITLEEAKEYLRVEGSDDDATIQTILTGAIMYAEKYLNRTVGSNTYKMSLGSFTEIIRLMRPPVSLVTDISYVDVDGADQVFDVENTKLNIDQGILYCKIGEAWPETGEDPFAVTISYTSEGVFNGNDGDDILTAIKLILTYQYDFRDDPNQRWKKASDNILSQLRYRPFE